MAKIEFAKIAFVRVIKGRYGFFRTKETGDVRLPGAVGSAEFWRKYAELIERRERIRSGAASEPDTASFSWLIDRYLASAEYAALADETQRGYDRTLELIRAELGDQPFRLTTRTMLKVVRDGHAATPRKAHKIKQMLSRLFSWADGESLVADGFNPAAGLKRLARKGGEREIEVWSDAEIGWFLDAAPPHVRLPVLIALYTGQRREDVATMVWSQWQSDIVRVRQSKTGQLLDIACHPVLKAELERARAERKVVAFGGHIALTVRGKPFTAGGLSGAVRRVVLTIDAMPRNRSMHGLRYAAGSRMDEGGATVSQIEAVLGHRTFKMALKYAGQRVRAAGGVAAMSRSAEGSSGN